MNANRRFKPASVPADRGEAVSGMMPDVERMVPRTAPAAVTVDAQLSVKLQFTSPKGFLGDRQPAGKQRHRTTTSITANPRLPHTRTLPFPDASASAHP